jgi:hypothetical protein
MLLISRVSNNSGIVGRQIRNRGAVATWSETIRNELIATGPGRYRSSVPHLSTHDAERPATDPVATAPGSVFVDPRC